jgi:hypothetical protein
MNILQRFNKRSFLSKALKARDEELAIYEINITNYREMLRIIDRQTDADLIGPFKQDITERLAAELVQWRRAKIIRAAIAQHLAQLSTKAK